MVYISETLVREVEEVMVIVAEVDEVVVVVFMVVEAEKEVELWW